MFEGAGTLICKQINYSKPYPLLIFIYTVPLDLTMLKGRKEDKPMNRKWKNCLFVEFQAFGRPCCRKRWQWQG